MEDKTYQVEIFYTGFCVYDVTAKNEAEAILKARNLPINQNEFLTTLENWKDADTITGIKDEKSKI